MGKTKKKVIFVVMAIILVVTIIVQSNPLRRSKEQIRESMLQLTPVGTSVEDVLKVIEGNEKWKNWGIKECGYALWGGQPSLATRNETRNVVGVKTIQAWIGTYGIFETGVSAFWGFDEDGKLIDIAVRKDRNTL